MKLLTSLETSMETVVIIQIQISFAIISSNIGFKKNNKQQKKVGNILTSYSVLSYHNHIFYTFYKCLENS